jgi:phage tail protein X
VGVPGPYQVRHGDTLSAIARRFYGHARLWPALWWTNHRLVHNPNVLLAGTNLTLARWHPDREWIMAKALRHIPQPKPVHVPASPTSSQGAADPAPAAPANPPAQPAASSGSVSAGSSFEQCVIRAESGGNPVAQNPTSTASGLYGFLSSTWTAVTGLPGPARDYSVAQQQAAFQKLYAEAGPSPWSAYDGC